MRRSLLALLLVLPACSDGGDGPGGPDGRKLYRAQACFSCHGAEGQGGALAPPLAQLADNWTREQIAEYLTDPLTVVERTPRLKQLKNRYNTQMPALTLSLGERLTLADYVLELSAARGE